jgi:hypothetical protein
LCVSEGMCVPAHFVSYIATHIVTMTKTVRSWKKERPVGSEKE